MSMEKTKSPFDSNRLIEDGWEAVQEAVRVAFPVGIVENVIIEDLKVVGNAGNMLGVVISHTTENGTATISSTIFPPSKTFCKTEDDWVFQQNRAMAQVFEVLGCVYKEKTPRIMATEWEDWIRKAVVKFQIGDARGENCMGVFEYDKRGYVQLRKLYKKPSLVRMDSGKKLWPLIGTERLERPKLESYSDDKPVVPHVVVDYDTQATSTPSDPEDMLPF